MQPLDPAGVYSSAAVTAALTGQAGTRTLAFRYDRLDLNNNYIEPITTVIDAKISNDALGSIKRTATFRLLDVSGINYGSDRIRPWARLNMPDGGWIEWPLGVFLLASPTRLLDPGGYVVRDVAAYDQLLVLQQDQISDRYSVAAGLVYTDAIATLVAGYPFVKAITPSASTLPVAREWAPGVTKLQILNDLLGDISYSSATFDEQGSLICKPYNTPASRASEYTYADDFTSTLLGTIEQGIDLYSVPNKWVLVQSEPNGAAPIIGTYTNVNPLSPTSTVSRGRTITKIVVESLAADLTTLNALAANMAFRDSQVYETIKMPTALMPMHSDSDVLTLNVGGLGIFAKYVEHAWVMPLKAGATMSHSVRRVVVV